jgi:hypothetical protein
MTTVLNGRKGQVARAMSTVGVQLLFAQCSRKNIAMGISRAMKKVTGKDDSEQYIIK